MIHKNIIKHQNDIHQIGMNNVKKIYLRVIYLHTKKCILSVTIYKGIIIQFHIWLHEPIFYNQIMKFIGAVFFRYSKS